MAKELPFIEGETGKDATELTGATGGITVNVSTGGSVPPPTEEVEMQT